MSRAPSALATLAVLAVIAAGCGDGSAGTGGRSATSGAHGTASVHERAVRFARCMRANGVSGFPIPGPSAPFTVDGVVNGSSLNPDSAAWRRAVGACKSLEPPGFTGSRVTPRQRTARLEFARCMRGHGVPDFPDPTANGPLVDTNRIPSSDTASGMSALNAAMHRCGAVYGGELGLGGV